MNVCGGRGKCRVCGGTFNNVAYHESRCGQKIEIPQLDSTYPVVLYFGTKEDADGFIALVRESNPNLKIETPLNLI